MDQFEKKEVIQAILIADNNVENFQPMSDQTSTALLPLVNVAMLDYALEALNESGIEEVFVYARLFINDVRRHIKLGIAAMRTWSMNMTVHVIGGEGSRTFGDSMRDLDAKALIRGNFILLSANTVTNVKLKPIFEEHKKHTKYDKGAAATILLKESYTPNCTGNEVMIALNTQNQRLHHHQRLQPRSESQSSQSKEAPFEVPLEVFINNPQVALHHNLLDPQIAIGSPSMLSLFSDNFDFQTRDDFIRGLLINEDILDSRIYVSLLPAGQYARRINNWQTYQQISQEIINRWAYPIVPDMGIHCLHQNYIYLRNNIYKSGNANVAQAALRENVVVQSGSIIAAGTSVSNSVIGINCKIGQNCVLNNAYVMDNVSIADGCVLQYCVVGAGAMLAAGAEITDGSVLGDDCVLPANSKVAGLLVKSSLEDEEHANSALQLGPKAFVIDDKQPSQYSDSDEPLPTGIPKMSQLDFNDDESDYNPSIDDDESRESSPIPDDANIFLSEVMDSLMRGFKEKSNPDFLILEINSSRYAYNMSLKEVNFYVVKAIFSLPMIAEPANNNVLVAINTVLKQLGPVMTNYIKTEEAMMDCLKALEDLYEENTFICEKISQVLHYMYDKDFVTEDVITDWHEQLDELQHAELKQSLNKFIEWLGQSSEEEDDDDDEDDESD